MDSPYCIIIITQVSVAEEVGSVSLLIVRAQGLLGDISVEWRTIDGTARSAGKSPPDYQVGLKLFCRINTENIIEKSSSKSSSIIILL